MPEPESSGQNHPLWLPLRAARLDGGSSMATNNVNLSSPSATTTTSTTSTPRPIANGETSAGSATTVPNGARPHTFCMYADLVATQGPIGGPASPVTVKEKTLMLSASPPLPASPLIVEAAGQKYAQTTEFRSLGGLVNEHATSPRRSTAGAKQRGPVSGDMPRSASTGRERRVDLRPAYSRRRTWRHCCLAT